MTELIPPLSKSDAQRALVLADIVGASGLIPDGEVMPRDVDVLRSGLFALRSPEADIDCRDGGAPFRFLVTQAALSGCRRVRFTGTPRLGERPHEPLLTSLRAALGCRFTHGDTFFPLEVTPGPEPFSVRRFSVTGVESSQFASSLLLGAARVAHQGRHACEVEVQGDLTSVGYLDLTRAWVERAGFSVQVDGQTFRVEAGAPRPFPAIPGDWSSLTYLLLLGWRASLPVARVQRDSGHPDEAFAALLETVGLRLVPAEGGRVLVEGTPTGGLLVDCQQCPDAVPALVALACVLPRHSHFERIGILRHKESDRVEGVVDFARRVGATATVEGETLTVQRAEAPRDFTFDARHDHRLAMASATLSSLTSVNLALTGRDSVTKSFPGFWTEAAKAGLSVGSA